MKVKLMVSEIMKEKEWNQKKLEEVTGIPQSVISMMIRGKKDSIKFEHIVKIAKAYGTNDISKIIKLVNKEDSTT